MTKSCIHVRVVFKRYSSSSPSSSLVFFSAERSGIDNCASWRGQLFARHELSQEKLGLLIFMILLFLHLFLVLQLINLILEPQNGKFKELILFFDVFNLSLKEVLLLCDITEIDFELFDVLLQIQVLSIDVYLFLPYRLYR